MLNSKKPTVLFLSTYPPRECGIATFTRDIVARMRDGEKVTAKVIAIDAGAEQYGPEVAYHFSQYDADAWARAADWVNRKSGADLVMVEHEYGIFGGPDGELLLKFTAKLNIPYLLTCHTVLREPSANQKRVLTKLCAGSAGIVAMSNLSCGMLRDIYGAEESKLHMIHHGVPEFCTQDDREELKKQEGFSGRTIVSTFGLLSSGKGLEYGIEAIRRVAKKHPEVLYLILGPTHPVVKREHGEEYRHALEALVESFGIADNVKFVDHYLVTEEIVHYLKLSDIYMTPYLNMEQAVSGTLACAVGCGRVVVSTPYQYAQEMLGDGRGLLAEPENADSLAQAVGKLLDDPGMRHGMEEKAALLGKEMTWPVVVGRYEGLVEETARSCGREGREAV